MAVVNTGNRAFTLIELLIVVAIIAILAAIAVPNFLDAQIRAKVARVTADIRTMQTAVEIYRTDHNKLPVRRDAWNNPAATLKYAPPADTKIADPANQDAKVGLKQITTPVSYLSSIPTDVFNLAMRGSTTPGVTDSLDYWDDVQVQATRKYLNGFSSVGIAKGPYALLSVGPDGYLGVLQPPLATYPANPSVQNTFRWFYDPTNGSRSAGNIYRFSTSNRQEDLFPIP